MYCSAQSTSNMVRQIGSDSYNILQPISGGHNAMAYDACDSGGQHIVLLERNTFFAQGAKTPNNIDHERDMRSKNAFQYGARAYPSGRIEFFSKPEAGDYAPDHILLHMRYTGTLATGMATDAVVSWQNAASYTLLFLDALKDYHEQDMLHLSLSPQSLLLPYPPSPRGMLLDCENIFYLINSGKHCRFVMEPYSAPELRLGDYRAISPSTDLFSVCVVFAELLTNKQFSFENLSGGEPRDMFALEESLLNGQSARVQRAAIRIIRRGLRLSIRQRYQSIAHMAQDLIALREESE